jgi:HD-GYP domain-containing protein (c-di-GMP phosphodiesterase class II)
MLARMGPQGEDIPLLGRILAVADAHSAMATDRSYRKALPPDQTRPELRHAAGSQPDPTIVEAFLAVLEDEDWAAREAAADPLVAWA